MNILGNTPCKYCHLVNLTYPGSYRKPEPAAATIPSTDHPPDTGLSSVDTGLSSVDTGPSSVDTGPSSVDTGPSSVDTGREFRGHRLEFLDTAVNA